MTIDQWLQRILAALGAVGTIMWILGTILGPIAKAKGWTRTQWVIEGGMPLAVQAMARAAAAPRNANAIDELAKIIVASQKSNAVQLRVNPPPPPDMKETAIQSVPIPAAAMPTPPEGSPAPIFPPIKQEQP